MWESQKSFSPTTTPQSIGQLPAALQSEDEPRMDTNPKRGSRDSPGEFLATERRPLAPDRRKPKTPRSYLWEFVSIGG